MTAWAGQPPALAATLNPLLVGAAVAWACGGYRQVAGGAMPLPLAFVIPGLVLHQPTRDVLPRAASKRLLAWQREHEEVVAALPARCQALRPFTLAGLRAGLRHGLLVADGSGFLPGPRAGGRVAEVEDVRRAAALVGRWLAPVRPVTVLSQLGMTT